eukprot:gene7410-8196_t
MNSLPNGSRDKENHPPLQEKTSSTDMANDNDMAFVCNICLEGVKDRDPVVTQCGHLYCWPCLYRWLNTRHGDGTCPICKAGVTQDNVIPIFIRPSVSDPRSRTHAMPGNVDIPSRPQAHRPEPVNSRGLFTTNGTYSAQLGGMTFAASALDVSNAFNTVPRRRIMEGFQAYCPRNHSVVSLGILGASQLLDSFEREVGWNEGRKTFNELLATKPADRVAISSFISNDLDKLEKAMILYGDSLRRGELPDEISRNAEGLAHTFAQSLRQINQNSDLDASLKEAKLAFDNYLAFVKI